VIDNNGNINTCSATVNVPTTPLDHVQAKAVYLDATGHRASFPPTCLTAARQLRDGQFGLRLAEHLDAPNLVQHGPLSPSTMPWQCGDLRDDRNGSGQHAASRDCPANISTNTVRAADCDQSVSWRRQRRPTLHGASRIAITYYLITDWRADLDHLAEHLPGGTTTVTAKAVDGAGNTSTCTFTATVVTTRRGHQRLSERYRPGTDADKSARW